MKKLFGLIAVLLALTLATPLSYAQPVEEDNTSVATINNAEGVVEADAEGNSEDETTVSALTSLNLSELLEKLPNVKQGIAYSFEDEGLEYLSTVNAVKWKFINGEVGYATSNKAVVVVSADVFSMADHTTLPILDLIEFKPGIYVGVKQLGSDMEFDYGLSATFLEVKF